MIITDFLSSTNVLMNFQVPSVRSLLDELAKRAALKMTCNPKELSLALQKREELGSTAMGGGVAIPHARFSFIVKPFGIFAKLKQPIDFGAIDGQPVDLVFLLLLSASAETGQLGALALVARKLRATEGVTMMRNAKTADELYSAIAFEPH